MCSAWGHLGNVFKEGAESIVMLNLFCTCGSSFFLHSKLRLGVDEEEDMFFVLLTLRIPKPPLTCGIYKTGPLIAA